MSIHDIPTIERPREKLIRYGVQKLSNTELLAIILGSGIKGKNVIELARAIFKKFPRDELATAQFHELKEHAGLGTTKSCQILACFELGKRLLKHKTVALLLQPKDVWEELREIRDNKKEHCIVFYLDVRNNIIKKETISIGTLNANLIHPREVFEPAVKHSAAQILIAHNHPSGEATPSEEDIAITKRLVEAGQILGIELTDHVIVTKGDYFSFKERKII